MTPLSAAAALARTIEEGAATQEEHLAFIALVTDPLNVLAWEREREALVQALDIITRACEYGAYTGKTSPAVTQARAKIEQYKNTPAQEEK